ncbi:hypothetical protein MUK42_14268 [Musa troglodytarum]|uniref:phosphoribosylaminoimidazole carboxylase n=1 Tax=Musa troglodytarum TaxID=320322 RepID=A0A9E7IAT9_9LILI|nr:hypothetical protein MUK42_14268 [Musa troglodytarum]
MTTLRLGSTACSAVLSRDRRPSSSYGHSAPSRALASCGGGEAVLGFSFRPNKRSPMTLASPSRSARAARFVASSQDHGDGSSSERHDGSAKGGVSNTVVGVLGGGQLGRMLCQAASQMAVKVVILDPLESCPASGLAYQHVVGSFDDGDAVREFAKRCGVLTVEIEHVDAVTLEKLELQGIDCQPKASTIRIIQDKYLQKVHFSQQGIPLPDFMEIDNLANTEKAGELFGYPLMIKSKRLAYDGRGNAVAHTKAELPSVVAALGGFDHGLYVERWTPFVKLILDLSVVLYSFEFAGAIICFLRQSTLSDFLGAELSVIVARARDNSVSCFPVVETIHKNNICHIVESPADVPNKIKKLAVDIAQKAVKSLEGAGVFAVELFLTKDGQVLLNEVAPRPHNSGHHTIESCYTSQYEQHLRAILGLPLGDPSMKTPAAIMYNILGEDEGEAGFHLAHQLMGKALKIPGANIHWYDKPEMRKLRKMGHITIVGPSKNVVKERLDSLLERETPGSHGVVTPRVAIIMGSDSDLPTMKDAAEILKNFGVPHEVTIVSAHRTPERMYSFASSAKERGIQIIIAGAGGAAHLPGMVASLTPLPVIGVPIRTSSLDGIDSLLSIVQMPKGIPVATVAIGNAANAALLAVRILAAGDADLWDRVIKYQDDLKDTVMTKATKLEAEDFYVGKKIQVPSFRDCLKERRTVQMLTVSREVAIEVQGDTANMFTYAVLRLTPHALSSNTSSWSYLRRGVSGSSITASSGLLNSRSSPEEYHHGSHDSSMGEQSNRYHMPRPLQRDNWSKGKDGFLVCDIQLNVGGLVYLAPVVWLQQSEEHMYLCIYQHRSLTIIILIPASEKIVHVEEKLSRGWGGENAYHVSGYRYLLVDTDKSISRTSPPGKVMTLAKDSLLTLNKLREEVDLEKTRANREKPDHEKNLEICIRAKNNSWIIAKITQGRELYMAIEKANETLLYASDAVEKFSDRCSS